MNLSQAVVSRLGSHQEPFGWSDGIVVLTVLALLVAVELTFGKVLRKVASAMWSRMSRSSRDEP